MKRTNKTTGTTLAAAVGITLIAVTSLVGIVGVEHPHNNNHNQTEQAEQTEQTEQAEQAELSLVETTPLKEYCWWEVSGDFPRFKMEAAEEVEELMENGLSEEEACKTAIDHATDKQYNLYVEFGKFYMETYGDEWDNGITDEEYDKIKVEYFSENQKID